MSEPCILIVEDEAAIREMLKLNLNAAGFSVLEAEDAKQALAIIFERLPALVLLDWMLPGMSGLELAQRMKKDNLTKDTPIIMLTARVEEENKIRGLNVGADDYITKPFSPRELIARIKAVLRRTDAFVGNPVVIVDEVQLFTEEHRVLVRGEEIKMGPTEFRLLHFFMTHPKRVYSRNHVIDQVWGGNIYIEERTVDVHIGRLRKALAEYQYDHLIETVRGVGYRLALPQQE